jgi:hypothetical protein
MFAARWTRRREPDGLTAELGSDLDFYSPARWLD